MKKFFFFTCIFIFSILFFYFIGRSVTGTVSIAAWSRNAQNYYISGVLNLTLFTTLWMIEQPWAQKTKKKKYSAPSRTRLFFYKIMDAIRA
jgi:hypothetical protein